MEISQLKDTPCVLISSPEQRENECAFYRDVVGFGGDFLFAENLKEARMLVVSGRGVMPIEGGSHPAQLGGALCRIPLTRNGKPIRHKYCAFWKTDNSGRYVEAFAEMLKAQFAGGAEANEKYGLMEAILMTIEQVRRAYLDKKDTPCPITQRLIMSGYQQGKSGYIQYAHECGMEVDYRKAQPTQW